MRLQYFLTTLELNFIKFFNMKKQPTKKVICIERADNFIRCFLCESKYEALERCISQDDYKYPRKYYKVVKK